MFENTRKTLTILIALFGGGAGFWNGLMLDGGLQASGQLDSVYNRLGEHLTLLAAVVIVGSTALFYHVLMNRRRSSRLLLWLSGGIVLLLSIFASLTQTFMVVDGALGDSFQKATETRVGTAWQEAARIDQGMVRAYRLQLGHFRARMEEEERTGRGPRFRGAERDLIELRQEFSNALSEPEPVAQQGRSISGDVGALEGYIEALRAKAAVFGRFSLRAGIATKNFAARLDQVEASLSRLSGGEWIDRRSLVYGRVLSKLWEMIVSFGTADLGFTLAFLLALCPDAIQLLCACLIRLLTAKEEDSEDGFNSGWSPFDRVWGERPNDRDQ